MKRRLEEGESVACEVVGHFDTSLHGLDRARIPSIEFHLLDAQRVVARQYGFSSWRRLKLFVDRSSAHAGVDRDSRFQKVLEEDDQIRRLLRKRREDGSDREVVRRLRELGAQANAVLEPVYDRHGWPGPDLIGAEGVDACFHVAANAVYDSQLQARTAELMEAALPEGKIHGFHYVPTVDRWLALSGRPTLFGTMPGFDADGRLLFSEDVVDPKNLDVRRARMGYRSFEAQRRAEIERLEGSEDELYPDQAKWYAYKADTARKGGYVT